MFTTRDQLNAFLDLPAIDPTHAADGPLAGLTLGVKDIFDVAALPTGCGNPVLARDAHPARRTAPAIQKLLDAGARFTGKTQTDELAFSLFGQNAHVPHPVNPRAPARVTGGSSSGSAAAVAGGLVDIATGSDTGGSIRAPASFCGLIGLRATHGAIPLDGAMPLAPSLDTFGWFAQDIDIYEKVARVLLDAPPLAGERVEEGTSRRLLSVAALDELLLGSEEAAEYRRMAGLVAERLGSPSPAGSPPFTADELFWCFRKIQAKEAWNAHGRWISQGERGLAPAVQERFAYGAAIPLPELLAEGEKRSAFRGWLADLLGEDGMLMLPTVPGAAPFAASTAEEFAAYRERALKLLCWSGLSGFPQITLPLGTVASAPFGLSLLGPPGSDLRLVALARMLLHMPDRWTR